MPLKIVFHFSFWLKALKNKDFLALKNLDHIHLKKNIQYTQKGKQNKAIIPLLLCTTYKKCSAWVPLSHP